MALRVPTVPPAEFSETELELNATPDGAALTVRLNVSNTTALPASVAETLTAMTPTSPLTGVPLNVRVAASKLSQAGNALPFDSVAA